MVDPAGNILARDAAAGEGDAAPGDRLLRYRDGGEERTFAYDAWGNRVRETRRGPGGDVSEVAYRYGADDQLREVRGVGRDGAGRVTRFGYDALGRRVWKATARLTAALGTAAALALGGAAQAGASEVAPEPAPDALERIAFLWSGDVLAAESAQPREDALATVYVYEPGTFRPLAVAKRDGYGRPAAVYRYHLDHLGTPQELTGVDGGLAWAPAQQAWGATAADTSGALAQPLRFQGQYADGETGLHYNRHRYYSPAEGRFVTQDPVRLLGGENIASYAPNPVAWVDPLGLSCTYDTGANRWRDQQTGRFRTRPDDPVELVHGGSVKHGDIQAWANQRSLPNQWTDPHGNFPSGGFKYRTSSGGYDYQVHGHGASTTAPAGSNSALGPTARIGRRPTGGPFSSQRSGLQSGGYGPYPGNENAAHIPLTGSPY